MIKLEESRPHYERFMVENVQDKKLYIFVLFE